MSEVEVHTKAEMDALPPGVTAVVRGGDWVVPMSRTVRSHWPASVQHLDANVWTRE